MIRKTISNFDLSQICASGQCFRMRETAPGTYVIPSGERLVRVMQNGEDCVFDCPEQEFDVYWKDYFDLENDYAGYIEQINPRGYLSERSGGNWEEASGSSDRICGKPSSLS